jgi:flavin-dependent dehydrogenase
LGDAIKGKAGEQPPVGLMIDKGRWNKIMIDEARQYGVEIFNNTNITNVRKEPECVVLTDHQGNEYLGTFVIAADGVNSRIARKLGFNKERIFLGTYKDMARTYEGAEIPEADTLMFCMGWKNSISIAPELTEGHFHLSAASYNVNADLDSELDRFLSSEPFASWFKNAKEIGHRTSCVSNIDYLVSLAPEILPGTMNFFVIMRSIGRTFAGLLPKIQEERPDIMQKLLAMRSSPKELALARRRNEGCAIVS